MYLDTTFCKTSFFNKITKKELKRLLLEHLTFKWNLILWSLPIVNCIQKDYSPWIHHNCSMQISKNRSILLKAIHLAIVKKFRDIVSYSSLPVLFRILEPVNRQISVNTASIVYLTFPKQTNNSWPLNKLLPLVYGKGKRHPMLT